MKGIDLIVSYEGFMINEIFMKTINYTGYMVKLHINIMNKYMCQLSEL